MRHHLSGRAWICNMACGMVNQPCYSFVEDPESGDPIRCIFISGKANWEEIACDDLVKIIKGIPPSLRCPSRNAPDEA